MSRRVGLTGAVILALAVIIVAIAVRSRADTADTAEVVRGSIDVTIQTVGTIQATEASIVRSAVPGTVEILGAAPGDVIREGDILVVLDQRPFTRAVAEVQAQLVQAEFALQLAEYRAGEAPDDEARRFDVLAAADRVSRAERSILDAEEQQRRSVILAPRSGTIIELTVRQGDAVGANQILARIAQPDDARLVADVDELDLPNVAPGATARFRLDAYPATEITGVVLTTSPVARQQGGATVFSTTIQIELPDGIDVRPGMNADVTIVTDAREDVLLIPERALRTVGTRSFVLIEEDGSRSEREVTLGYRGQGQVEVVAGLAEGERVVLR